MVSSYPDPWPVCYSPARVGSQTFDGQMNLYWRIFSRKVKYSDFGKLVDS